MARLLPMTIVACLCLFSQGCCTRYKDVYGDGRTRPKREGVTSREIAFGPIQQGPHTQDIDAGALPESTYTIVFEGESADEDVPAESFVCSVQVIMRTRSGETVKREFLDVKFVRQTHQGKTVWRSQRVAFTPSKRSTIVLSIWFASERDRRILGPDAHLVLNAYSYFGSC